MSKQSKIVGFFKKSMEDSAEVEKEAELVSDDEKSEKSSENDKAQRNEEIDEDVQEVSSSILAGPSTEVTVADKIDKPSIWTEEMWREKQQRYPWLMCKNGKLGCDFCLSAKSLAGPHSTQGLHLSSEWQTTNVTYNGVTQEGRLTSLRKKIYKHVRSQAHIKAKEMVNTQKRNSIPAHVDAMNSKMFDTTKRVFRTSYFIAKKD